MNGGGEESNVQYVGFPCVQCPKIYKTKDNLTRHVKAKHSGVTFPCSTCGKVLEYVGARTRHEKSCNPGVKAFDCDICGKRCATEGGLRREQEVHQGPSKPPPTKSNPPKAKKAGVKRKNQEPGPSGVSKKPRTSPEEFRCRRCHETFINHRDLYGHGLRQHYQVGGGSQPVPWGDNPAPWANEDGTAGNVLQLFATCGKRISTR